MNTSMTLLWRLNILEFTLTQNRLFERRTIPVSGEVAETEGLRDELITILSD